MDVNITVLLCILFATAVSSVVIKIINITAKSRLDLAKLTDEHAKLRARIARAKETIQSPVSVVSTSTAACKVDELDEFLGQL